LATVLAKTGQTTDQSRDAAARALPDTISYDELKAAISASTKAADAVVKGNKTVMDAIKSGKSLQEAINAGAPKVFATPEAAAAARKIGKLQDGDKVIVGGNRMIWKDN
jgi:hypothetical protein